MIQRERINAEDPQDVLAWAKSLNTTPERLREAVQAVGGDPAQVLAQLSKQPRRGRVAWTWLSPAVSDGSHRPSGRRSRKQTP